MSNVAKGSTYVASAAADAAPESDLVSAFFASVIRNTGAIIVTSLALAAVLIASYIILVRPLFSSETYLNADRDTLVQMNVLVQSPLVLDAAAQRAGLDQSSKDIARDRVRKHISFRPAPGENRSDARVDTRVGENQPNTRIFLLDVKDSSAQTALDVANVVIEKWKAALTPKSQDRDKIEGELARQTEKKGELDNIIAHFGKEVTTFVTPQTRSGEVATPLVALLNQQTDLAKKIENLRGELDGAQKFTIVVGPTPPDRARRPMGWATLIVGSVIGSFIVILGLVAMNMLRYQIWSRDGNRGEARRE